MDIPYVCAEIPNYIALSLRAQKRGYRPCDQCGEVEAPPMKYKLCGACMTTQYCSERCQKLHWPLHRDICKHTAAQIKQSDQANGVDGNIARTLRKFISRHSSLLGWAGFQALQLKHSPANINNQALLVQLIHNDSPYHMERHRQLSISATHIVPWTYIQDPLVIVDIRRREMRCRREGGLGALLVIVQCGPMAQIMPVEVDSLAEIGWGDCEEWEAVLHHFTESDRRDFTH